jgi:hypothetical protein
MRSLLPLLVVPVLAACQASTAGSRPGDSPDDALPPPACVLDEAAEPVALHPFDPAATENGTPTFGACGHLLVSERLAGPDLAALEPLPGLGTGYTRFAPTGEWLAVETYPGAGARSDLIDLRTGQVTTFPGILGKSAFAPRRDREGSWVVRCDASGLVAFDGQASRPIAPAPVACDERLVAAPAAPVVVYAGAGDRLHVADLERGTDLALPFDAPAGPGTGQGYEEGRHDRLHVSPDGTLLLYQRVVEIFDLDYFADRPDPEVSLIDLGSGAVLGTYPASEAEPVEAVDLPGRGHGLLWATGGHTYEVAPDTSVQDFPVEVGVLAWAGATGVVGRQWNGRDDAGWARLDFSRGTWDPLDPALGEPVVSASGRRIARTLPNDYLRSRIDIDGGESREVRGVVQWLGDDGTALVLDVTRLLDGYRLVLRDPTGAELAATTECGPDPSLRAEVRAVPGGLVALAAGRLFVFDLAGGEPTPLATHVTDFRIDASGRRIAYQVEQSPDDHLLDLVLSAGRLAP